MALRYKELFNNESAGEGRDGISFDIEGYLTEIDTGKIDSDYMNSTFSKYLKKLQEGESKISLEEALNELHKTFASLTQEEQKFANIFLHDIQRGDVVPEKNKTLRDYITEYQFKAKNEQITYLVAVFGLDEAKLRQLLSISINENNINEYGCFDELRNSVDKTKAKHYFEKLEGKSIPVFKINIKLTNLLRQFILNDGIDLK